ncbi:MAG: ATP-binding protein [Pseudomonadota bacterium]
MRSSGGGGYPLDMTSDTPSGIAARSATTIIIVTSLALMLAGVLALPRVQAHFLDDAQEANKAVTRLVAGGIHQAIRRFEPLPQLIAEMPSLRAALKDPENQGLVPFVNEKLRHTAQAVDVSDIFLMDRNGRTIAASNYRKDRSFVGRIFDYRPYFQSAVVGEAAQFHALGTTSGEPGFFFAAPVLDGIEIVGVLAVKVTTDAIESSWAGSDREILVTDGNGIVFLTSRQDLRFRSLSPLSQQARERIVETRQYPLDAIAPLSLSQASTAKGVIELQLEQDADPVSYLSDRLTLDLPGWHAIVITPMSPIMARALYVLAFWALGVVALALAATIIIQRRARVAERMRVERSQRAILEETVQARTAELRTTNASLSAEVAERRSAEERLRQTQQELVQAGKLAALGQMSAALSHEINQPLAAVKSYSENAVAYLDRARIDEARKNLGNISKMADRMAKISGHLRNFARRPGEELSAIPVAQVIEEAISVIEPLVRKRRAELQYAPPREHIWAMGGRLRLQQVIVNLLTNALDAMVEQPDVRVEIGVEATAETVEITVRDYGPGLTRADEEQMFEPFFTTKPVGKGMGLGLSISFNIVEDFGGKLTAANHPDGGAIFQVRLRRAAAGQSTAHALVAE